MFSLYRVAVQVRGSLATLDVAGVSLPIALGLWLMMWPVLTKVKYELLGVLLKDVAVAKQFAMSFVLNWLIGPALMTALAWACLPDLPGFRNGVIMVGLARWVRQRLCKVLVTDLSGHLCVTSATGEGGAVMQVILWNQTVKETFQVMLHCKMRMHRKQLRQL
jgi:ACR3 family arsenite transporter